MRGRAFQSRNQFLEAAASVEPGPAPNQQRCSVQTAGDPDVYEAPDGLMRNPLLRESTD